METDPTGRFTRTSQLLGGGASKCVYVGYDLEEGMEVAWNQVRLSDNLDHKAREQLMLEVNVLKRVRHPRIMAFYACWVDNDMQVLNFITEYFQSGTLRRHRWEHKRVPQRVRKSWAWQILQGLVYLHGLDPPIIHRDLKCDNIFVHGMMGEVKIGDFGLARLMDDALAVCATVVGTPEFMAPELYDEMYNEKVDIYAFGMCLLELETLQYPYSECKNIAQIFRQVSQGIPPQSLGQVKDPETRAFIELCINKSPDKRPSAKELSEHPYFENVKRRRAASMNPQATVIDTNSIFFLGDLDEDGKMKSPKHGDGYSLDNENNATIDVNTCIVHETDEKTVDGIKSVGGYSVESGIIPGLTSGSDGATHSCVTPIHSLELQSARVPDVGDGATTPNLIRSGYLEHVDSLSSGDTSYVEPSSSSADMDGGVSGASAQNNSESIMTSSISLRKGSSYLSDQLSRQTSQRSAETTGSSTVSPVGKTSILMVNAHGGITRQFIQGTDSVGDGEVCFEADISARSLKSKILTSKTDHESKGLPTSCCQISCPTIVKRTSEAVATKWRQFIRVRRQWLHKKVSQREKQKDVERRSYSCLFTLVRISISGLHRRSPSKEHV